MNRNQWRNLQLSPLSDAKFQINGMDNFWRSFSFCFVLSFICKWPGRMEEETPLCPWEISQQHGHMPKGRNHISFACLLFFLLMAMTICGQDATHSLWRQVKKETFPIHANSAFHSGWAFEPMTASNQSILITPTLSMTRDQVFKLQLKAPDQHSFIPLVCNFFVENSGVMESWLND